MTSNVGARDITSSSKMGFETSEDDELDYERIKERVKEEIDRTFAPEFLNRLDETIVFHPLSREQIGKIVHILLRNIQKRLGEEKLSISLNEEAVAFLVNVGYDTKFGARPLKRSIQRYIEDPLSEKILMAEFAPGDEIEVLLADDEESLRFRAASQASAT
jgi:ATP-dependent Clp protease ATP-binding subunit ClpC